MSVICDKRPKETVVINCENGEDGPEVKEEYIDDFIEETIQSQQIQWSCLEFEDVSGPRRFVTFQCGSGDIGDTVESTISGRLEHGILICNSDMGLTPMDLFNDILTNENDLKNFLEQSNVKTISTSSPGIIIQAYLVFVKKINGNVFDPINAPINNTENNPAVSALFSSTDGEPSRNDSRNEATEDDYEEIDNNAFEEADQNFDNDSADDFTSAGQNIKRRKVGDKVPFPPLTTEITTFGKTNTRKYQRKTKFNRKRTDEEKEISKPLDYETLIEDVKVSCSICMEGQPINPLPEWEQGKYDKVMSKHMWIKHQTKDFVMLEQEHNQRLLKSRIAVPEKIEVDGAQRIPCHLYPECDTVFIKALDFHIHRVYHEDLRKNIPIKLDFRRGFSCLAPGCKEIFVDYHDLRRHKQQQHPDVELKCRLCDSMFTSRSKRSSHWSLCHRIEENMTCEICGKTYDTRRQLTQHRRIHDESYHVTCDVCGKVFTSQNLLKKHTRWHIRNPEEKCPLCPRKFLYKGAVETHLVRDHGHERQYTCEFCGTQFIHQRHYRRHITKHEKNPEKVYRTQTTRRGYTKKTADYWDEKIILAGNASSKNKAIEQNPNHPHNMQRHTSILDKQPVQRSHLQLQENKELSVNATVNGVSETSTILAAAAARSQIGTLYENDTRQHPNTQVLPICLSLDENSYHATRQEKIYHEIHYNL